MWLVAKFTPSVHALAPIRVLMALALAGIGLALAGAGVLAFRKAKTTVNPTRPEAASAVVASGVFGISRKPMYLGLVFVYGLTLSVEISILWVHQIKKSRKKRGPS